MSIQDILTFIGGITLFIYGITLTSKNLEIFAFTGFRKFLDKITSKPIFGVALGSLFTALIQSSSATTIMVVSLANSGTMSFENTVGVIFGANIGTTATAQIIAFNLTGLGLPIFALGFLLSFLSKKESIKAIGNAIMGFGLIFIGMQFMENSVASLKDSKFFTDLFISMSKNPILGVLVSALFTGIEQSSSVTVGIVQALGAQKLIDLNAAFALIIGANIGTTVTALIAGIGTNIQAKRAAISHLLFNIIGAIIFLIIFKPYLSLISNTSSDLVRQIANAHTFFNIFCAFAMLPFTNQFVKLVKKLVPGEETIIETGTKFIDKRLLKIPSFALDALKKETIRLMEIVKGNMELVWGMIIKNSKKPIQQVLITENVINNINKEIQAFAPLLVSQSLPKEQSVEVNLYVNVSSQIERIGDIVKGTAELVEEKVQVGANFTDQAKEDLMKMLNIVNGEYEIIMQNFDDFNIECFNRIEGIEKEIDKMEVDLRNAHIERLMQGVCKPDAGIFYLDILSDLERVSDHIYKIAKLLKKFYKL